MSNEMIKRVEKTLKAAFADWGFVLRKAPLRSVAVMVVNDLDDEKERMKEALEWALREIDGENIYCRGDQQINARDCAEAALGRL